MTDRFDEIKERSQRCGSEYDDVLWLIDEVERLRAEKQRQDRIEDAARYWNHRRNVGCASDQFDIASRFVGVLEASRRPETDGE